MEECVKNSPIEISMRYFISLFLFISLLVSQISCDYARRFGDDRNKAETDLDTICKNLPAPSDFIDVDSKKNLDISKVAIFKHYKSRSSCKLIGEFYRDYFIGQNWDTNRMIEEQAGGGMKTLDFVFRDNDYVVWVACQNDVEPEAEKQVSVSCSWGLRPNDSTF